MSARERQQAEVDRLWLHLHEAYGVDRGGIPANWRAAVQPLSDAGWDDSDVLLWMVSPNHALGGAEPASRVGEPDFVSLVRTEALGVW